MATDSSGNSGNRDESGISREKEKKSNAGKWWDLSRREVKCVVVTTVSSPVVFMRVWGRGGGELQLQQQSDFGKTARANKLVHLRLCFNVENLPGKRGARIGAFCAGSGSPVLS